MKGLLNKSFILDIGFGDVSNSDNILITRTNGTGSISVNNNKIDVGISFSKITNEDIVMVINSLPVSLRFIRGDYRPEYDFEIKWSIGGNNLLCIFIRVDLNSYKSYQFINENGEVIVKEIK